MDRSVGRFMRPVVWSAVWLFVFATCLGTELTLKDGRVLRGKLVPLAGLAEKAELFKAGDTPAVPLIQMLDDDLRRTYVGRWQIARGPGTEGPEAGEALERFKLKQKTARGGLAIRSLGPLFEVQPFDEYGRRRLKMAGPRGPQDLVQAITEITPHYTKLEAEKYAWDMRIATSSIPRESLDAILKRTVSPTNVEERKRIARFYMQCERYEDAAREVEGILADNPENPEAKKQLDPALTAIRQLSARRTLEELKLRRDAGQHRMVLGLLKKFPSEGPAGETIQAVREMVREYDAQEAARVKVLEQFDQLAAKIEDSSLRKRVDGIREELSAELSLNTLARMAAFQQLANALKPEEGLALAISGWLVDSKGATTKLSTALSLVQVRALVLRYLAASDKLARAKILSEFQSEEGATVELVARLLGSMKPPLPAKPTDEAGLTYELEVPGQGNSPAVRCLVQLPPEYDPYRRYPAIVSLHGAGTKPEMQVEWWAGALDKQGWRAGQATRRGYVVIAPSWTAEHQKQYGYSAREHLAVTDSLRAACRRFSIDTDRVFLTGHSIGGDAAWDVALAHPDLWAGVVAIAAKGDKYVNLYWENGRLLPMYFVCGELDSSRSCAANARDWDRYLRSSGFNATVVEYLGRGHEHFSDEILRLFDWMGRMRRNFYPRELSAASMRPWDRFFWWVELDQLPARGMIDPDDWPASRRNIKPIVTKASITKTDTIHVQSGAGRVIVWLSPDMVDLKRRITVTIDGTRVPNAAAVVPDLEILLEDARTRADRQHPFWAKVEKGGGKVAASP